MCICIYKYIPQFYDEFEGVTIIENKYIIIFMFVLVIWMDNVYKSKISIIKFKLFHITYFRQYVSKLREVFMLICLIVHEINVFIFVKTQIYSYVFI